MLARDSRARAGATNPSGARPPHATAGAAGDWLVVALACAWPVALLELRKTWTSTLAPEA
jgi:hypothetical protein